MIDIPDDGDLDPLQKDNIQVAILFKSLTTYFISSQLTISLGITPVFLPGESHGQRKLAGYSPWGRRELNATEAT